MTRHDDGVDEAASHCPNCLAEYRAGFTTCADCGVELAPGPAPAEPAEDIERDPRDRPVTSPSDDVGDRVTEPVAVAELGSPEEAQLLAGRLRADGIPATVYPPDVSNYTRSYGFHRAFAVLVPKELAEQARASAKPFLEGSGDGGR